MTSDLLRVLVVESARSVAESLAAALRLEPDLDPATIFDEPGAWTPDVVLVGPGKMAEGPDALVRVLERFDRVTVLALGDELPGQPGGIINLPPASGIADVTNALRGASGRPPLPRSEPLSARELQIVRLLAAGKDPASVARRLGISLHTARQHVKNLRRKLGASSQLQAVAIATRLGLLNDDGPPDL